MTAIYAIALTLGIVGILAWVAAVAVAETVDGWRHVDPDRRYGPRGRTVVGAVSGFGLAGMSTTFAGWPWAAALAGAVAGSAAVAVIARTLGKADDGIEA